MLAERLGGSRKEPAIFDPRLVCGQLEPGEKSEGVVVLTDPVTGKKVKTFVELTTKGSETIAVFSPLVVVLNPLGVTKDVRVIGRKTEKNITGRAAILAIQFARHNGVNVMIIDDNRPGSTWKKLGFHEDRLNHQLIRKLG